MPELNCEISRSLLAAIAERRLRTGESTSQIVMRALADTLQVEHSTLFQISTTSALVEGVTDGAVTVRELSRHGDFGLGTFDGLDGEMVVVDGKVFQVTREGVRVASAESKVPFAVVTRFLPQQSAQFEAIASYDDLVDRLDELRGSANEFFAVRLEGHFLHIKTRAVTRSANQESLLEAASQQVEFEFHDVEGTCVGFWTPAYAKSLNLSGWHLHFLTSDRTGGGHLLDCQAATLSAQFEPLTDFRMAIPETAAFLKADLTRDTTEALKRAEGDH